MSSRASARTACARWAERCHEIVRLLRGSPKPLLAAINGTAVGGGLEMTLHCDLRFAATDARLGQPEINIGFIPPIATTQALARLIGRPRAIRYLYDGGLVPAAEALDWGLLDELVEPAGLRARVQAYGEELAAKSPAALAAIRRTVTLGGGMTFEDGMAFELETVVQLAGTPDFAEGVDAFLAKRPPVWPRHARAKSTQAELNDLTLRSSPLTRSTARHRVSKGGHEHRLCCPSFEDGASRLLRMRWFGLDGR